MSVFLTTKELAGRWHISPKTLNNWRTKQEGPSYVKVGKNVLYRLTDIEAYEVSNQKSSSVA